MLQVLKEGRLKNIITHLKKHGAPPDAAEAAEAAAAAAARLQLSEAAKPFRLLPVDKEAGLDVNVGPEVKRGSDTPHTRRVGCGGGGRGLICVCVWGENADMCVCGDGGRR